MKNIQKLLENINEKYYGSVDTVYGEIVGEKYTADVYKNSDASEILKLLKTSGASEKALRFFMNHAGDYIIWKAMDATHDDVLAGRSEVSFSDFNDEDLRGQIFKGGTHIYKASIDDFYPYDKEEQLEKFKQTKFYKNLDRAGLGEVEIGVWL